MFSDFAEADNAFLGEKPNQDKTVKIWWKPTV